MVEQNDIRDLFLIPKELLELIKNRFDIPAGVKVYNPFTGLAQLTAQFPGCFFFCEDSYKSFNKRWNDYCNKCRKEAHVVYNKRDIDYIWPWMKIALYANNVDATVIEDEMVPQVYDAAVSFIPYVPSGIPNEENDYTGEGPDDQETINKIRLMYQNLVDGGKMLLILPNECLWKGNADFSLESFWKKVIDDGSLKEIIQLPHIMGKSFRNESFSVVVIEKGNSDYEPTFIDARFAALKSDSSYYDSVLNLDDLNAMLQNDGIEERTGLRKKVKVPSFVIDPTLLVPQVYVTEGVSGDGIPVSLAELCAMSTKHVYDVNQDLPEDTPWVVESDLSGVYTGPLGSSSLKRANLPNNPKDWRYGKKRLSLFSVGEDGGGISSKDIQISLYRNCKIVDENQDAVLFKLTDDGIVTALINASSRAIAVNPDIYVLYPTGTVDAFSLLSVLSMPVVYRQMIAYSDFGLYEHFNNVLVPTGNHILYDEKQRLGTEYSMQINYDAKVAKLKKDHMDKLCNYQHGMRKHIREISSAVRRMERFINEMDSSDEIKSYLLQRLAHIKDQRQYLSEDIERLNEENTYGDSSPYDIDHSLRNYRDYFGCDVCPIRYTNVIANDAIRKYMKDHQEMLKELDENTRNKELEAVQTRSRMAYVDIAEYNFGKITRNILENAKKHGFDDFSDVNRKDCVIEIALNWDNERQMYRIDFRNNGNPLPEGLTKESYGENRKYAGKTGGTGIGGYEVAENVRHYSGDYAISQDGDWTVVSIYLPKSKTYEERL